MSEPDRSVLVRLLCSRRGHVMAKLIQEDGRLYIESYAHGTTFLPDGIDAQGNTIGRVEGKPARFKLAPETDDEGDPVALLTGRRYGCSCSRESFGMVDQEWRNAVAEGITVLREPAE